MNDSKFDQHFRDQLGNFRTPVDTDAIWTGVQSGMSGEASQSSPVRRWFWLLLLLLLIGGAGTAWWLLPSQNEAVTLNDNSPESTPESSAVPETELLSERRAVSRTEENEIKRENQNEAEQIQRESEDSEVAKVVEKNEIGQPEQTPVQKNQQKHSEKPTSKPEIENTATEKKIEIIGSERESEPRITVNPGSEKTVDRQPVNTEEKPESIAVVEADMTDAGEENKTENQFKEKPVPAKEKDLPEATKEENEVVEVSENDTVQKTVVGAADSSEKPLPAIENSPTENLAEQKPELSRSFFVRADFGVGLTSKKLQSLHSDWDTHTAMRSTTEKPMEHLEGQLLVGYRLPSGIYAASGISFTQITERFHVDRTYTETEIQEDQVSEILVDVNGDTTFVHVTHHVTHHFHQEVSVYNKYTLIDLPVIVGYEWNRNRWYLGLEAGLEFNLSLRTNGRMLAPTDEIVDLESSGMFRSNVSLSYLANLRVGYALSQRFEVFLTPGVRILPNSVLKQDVQHQTYNLYGIRLGTRIWLK